MPYTVVDKGSKYFNTVTWTGTGSTMSITGVGFQPDWVWYKGRSTAYNHGLFDAVRGTSNFLKSNSSDAEASVSGVTAFNSDGFSLGSDAGGVNSGSTYVAWNWLGANTTVSNTQGSITSTVSANTTAGFSIVSYTGNATSAQTIGHGLGVAPKMIICKNRSVSNSWTTYHASLGATKRVWLDLTNAEDIGGTSIWNNTAPTSTVFSVGNDGAVNGSSALMIAYCFAEIKGYSKFGSYTGNGSTDGTFVYTGFRPEFVLTKASSSTGQWIIHDTARDTFNQANRLLYPSLSNAEENNISDQIDILSNGFKIRATGSAINGSGVTYIYMAFAENPFVSSKGIPTTAR